MKLKHWYLSEKYLWHLKKALHILKITDNINNYDDTLSNAHALIDKTTHFMLENGWQGAKTMNITEN